MKQLQKIFKKYQKSKDLMNSPDNLQTLIQDIIACRSQSYVSQVDFSVSKQSKRLTDEVIDTEYEDELSNEKQRNPFNDTSASIYALNEDKNEFHTLPEFLGNSIQTVNGQIHLHNQTAPALDNAAKKID